MMAITKAKRSVPKKQSARRGGQSATRNGQSVQRRKVFHFPEVKDRVLKEIEFSIHPTYKCLELRFKDNTALSFEFEASFIWEAYFARWKSGEQRILRRWRPVKS